MAYYSKLSAAYLVASASLVPNNLSVHLKLDNSSIYYGVIHKSTLNIAHTVTSDICPDDSKKDLKEITYDDSGNKDPLSNILQAKWCELKSLRTVLVLTSYKGFQILQENGEEQLYSNKFETPQGSFKSRFARGIASIGNSVCVDWEFFSGKIHVFHVLNFLRGLIFITRHSDENWPYWTPPCLLPIEKGHVVYKTDQSTSEGTILVVNIPDKGCDVQFNRQLHGHSAPVSDIVRSNEGKLASCDENGMIIVWLDPLTCEETAIVISDASGIMCTSICFWNSLLIGGFANGQIFIYDSDSGAKMVEITAHARSIYAMDVASKTGLLLSVSEDCTVSVWKLPTKSHPQVLQEFSITLSDATLCGGKFCDPDGNKFAVTAYESVEITFFCKKS